MSSSPGKRRQGDSVRSRSACPPPPPASRIDLSDSARMNTNRAVSNSAGELVSMSKQGQRLREELRADHMSELDLVNQIEFLKQRKEEVLKEIAADEEWIRMHLEELKPVHEKYNALWTDMDVLVGNARQQFKKSVHTLETQLHLNPSYRKYDQQLEYMGVPVVAAQIGSPSHPIRKSGRESPSKNTSSVSRG